MKRIFFVTNCDPDRANSFEAATRKTFIKKSVIPRKKMDNPALRFAHANAPSHEIAEKVRAKKQCAVLFEKGCLPGKVQTIREAILKKLKDKTPPLFFHIGHIQTIEGVYPARNHAHVTQLFEELAIAM